MMIADEALAILEGGRKVSKLSAPRSWASRLRSGSFGGRGRAGLMGPWLYPRFSVEGRQPSGACLEGGSHSAPRGVGFLGWWLQQG